MTFEIHRNEDSVRILLIEDDTSFAELTKTFLEKEDNSFSIVTKSDGEEGLEYFNSAKIDCIVCDYDMPGKNGVEVLKEIRKESDIPFILYTGKGSEEVASEAISNGATDYLQKGSSQSKYTLLANKIRNYVEKHKTESAYEVTRQERDRVFNRINEGVISLDGEYNITRLNEFSSYMIAEATGADTDDKEQFIGKNLWKLIPELDGTEFKEKYIKANEEDVKIKFENYYEPLDMWFKVRVYPSIKSGISIFFESKTEQVKTEMKNKKQQELLMELYSIAADTEFESSQKLQKALQLGREFLGLSYGFITRIEDDTQTIMISDSPPEFTALQVGESCPLDEAYCKQTLKNEGFLAVNNVDPSGEFDSAYEHFGLKSYVGERIVIDGEVFGTICFGGEEPKDNEFTPQEKAVIELLSSWVSYEIENSQTKKSLREKNKKLDMFSSFVSHDLQNPLNIATGYLDLEREENDSENLERVADAHERMEDIIESLLEVSKSGSELVKTSDVDLAQLASDSWCNIESGTAKLDNSLSHSIYADEAKLGSVFENLFKNAIEHNEQDGLVIRVGHLDNRSGFYIEDNGEGIEEPDKILDHGYTTSSTGNGLGLVIVEEIVNAHDWELNITESTSGGARFEILL